MARGAGHSYCPLICAPKLWKRYVDDILEIIKKGETENLTQHLNQIDPTGSIKFTYEEERDGRIPFLDTLIIRKPDGSTKICIYRKATHTNQYLHFGSHHLLHQKLGVVRTLLDRKDAIVTEGDKKVEEDNIRQALAQCGYPEWTVNKVKKVKEHPRMAKKKAQNKNQDKSKSLVCRKA